MYQENKTKSSWIQFMLRSILILLIVVLTVKLVSLIIANRNQAESKNTMDNNLEKMMEVATDYFKENDTPQEVGKSIKISLEELIEKDLIDEIKDESEKACDQKESFIKITRLENEYQYKAYLVCDNETDYLNEFVEIKKDDIILKPSTTTTTTTKKKTTTKKTTTKKKTTTITTKKVVTTTKPTTTITKTYKVSFNSNGGNSVATQVIKTNEKAKNIIPYRNGYKFVGWYYHGSEFNFNTKINKDYILVAKWTK